MEAARSSQCPRHRLVFFLWLTLGSTPLIATPAAQGGSPPPGLDPSLAAAVRTVENAITNGNAMALRRLLPEATKVLLALDSFSRPRGYYAPDQVILIFRRIFDRYEVMEFRVDLDRSTVSPGGVFYAPASWSLRARAAAPVDCRVQLVLRQEGAVYRLLEIQELR